MKRRSGIQVFSLVACVGVYLLSAASAFAQDCNSNGVQDADDIAAGTSQDCNGNGIPDECDIAGGGVITEIIDATGDGADGPHSLRMMAGPPTPAANRRRRAAGKPCSGEKRSRVHLEDSE